MSSDYITRALKFGIDQVSSGTHPYTDCTLVFNYLLEAEPNIREVHSREFLISGSRDQKRDAILQEEVELRVGFDLCSFYPLYFAMGSISAVGSDGAYTIVPRATLPWMFFSRYLDPVEPGEKKVIHFWGMKANNCEITIEKGEVAKCDMTFIGKGAQYEDNAVLATTINYGFEPAVFYDFDVVLDGNTIAEVGRIAITIENNAERRLSVSTASGYRAYAVREGGLDISGRLQVGAQALTMLENVLERQSGHSILVKMKKNHGTITYGTLIMGNVTFEEYPERLRGIEPYEVEIPFACMPVTGGYALVATTSTLMV